jgi:hypothetical protein
MKKLCCLVALSLLFLTSCTGPKGDQGDTGPTGPTGPEQPGIYYIRIFQQEVYSTTYTGQVQASLWSGQSTAVYTNNSNPIGLGFDGTTGTFRPIIKFDLSSLPSTKIIVDKAELTIKSNSNSFGGGASTFMVHKVETPWTIFQAGWVNNTSSTGWDNSGGDFDSHTMTASMSYNLPASSTLTITLDPAVVQDWMMNPSTNYGMLMKVYDEDVTNYSEIYSSGAVVASNRPMLKIWYYTTE